MRLQLPMRSTKEEEPDLTAKTRESAEVLTATLRQMQADADARVDKWLARAVTMAEKTSNG